MTIPWQMNCPHLDDGWCLKCVGLQARLLETVTHNRDILAAACRDFFTLPNWRNRCGIWTDVNEALGRLHGVFTELEKDDANDHDQH